MGPFDVTLLVGILIAMPVLYVYRRQIAGELSEALDELMRNFRGGPPSGMHPSPADDGVIVLRRRTKVLPEHFRR